MKGFCTVRHPSCFSWEHVLQNVNSVNLPIKTLLAKEIRPASVILTCGTPDYTCKCTDSVGAFLSHIPLGSKQPKDPISESHPPEWENHSPLGSSVSQWKWIQRHLVYISISGRVWGKEKKKHAFILIKHYSSYWGGRGSWLEKNRTWYICEINVHESNISWEAALLISPGDTHSTIPAIFLSSAGLSRRCLPVSQSYFAEAPKFQSQEL